MKITRKPKSQTAEEVREELKEVKAEEKGKKKFTKKAVEETVKEEPKEEVKVTFPETITVEGKTVKKLKAVDINTFVGGYLSFEELDGVTTFKVVHVGKKVHLIDMTTTGKNEESYLIMQKEGFTHRSAKVKTSSGFKEVEIACYK